MMNSKLSTREKFPLSSSKFTVKEWESYNAEQVRTCADQQLISDKILAECEKVQDAFQEKAILNKREVEFQTQQKIKDSEFNRDETRRHRRAVCSVIESLIMYNNRVNGFYNYVRDTAIPITKKCIEIREQRLGIDLCSDDVELQLNREYRLMNDALPPLRSASEESMEQLRKLRSNLYFIDRDLEDKEGAVGIDKSNLELSPYSPNLCMYHGLKPLDPAKISIEEWESFSREIVKEATREIIITRKLQSHIENLLTKFIRELTAQNEIVNEAFERRIAETKEAKFKLEAHHSEIVRQANEMTQKILKIKASFGTKESFLALAHTRMGNRAQRTAMELCRDLVDLNLVNEVAELRRNRESLHHMISEVEASHRYLCGIRTKLEYDINVKTNSIKIDEVDCMTIRQGINYLPY